MIEEHGDLPLALMEFNMNNQNYTFIEVDGIDSVIELESGEFLFDSNDEISSERKVFLIDWGSDMSDEIRVHSTWYSDDDDENYSVTNIYVDDSGNTIICVTSLDSGVYEEWHINGFYKVFRFISQESL